MKRTLLVFVALLAIMPLATCEPAPAGAVEPPSAEECAALEKSLQELHSAGFALAVWRIQYGAALLNYSEEQVQVLKDSANRPDVKLEAWRRVRARTMSLTQAIAVAFGCSVEEPRDGGQPS